MIAIAKVARRKVNALWVLARVVFVSVSQNKLIARNKFLTEKKFLFAVTASCDQEVKNNITYIVSPSFPALMSADIKTCKLKVKMVSPDISQLRFDFVHFSMVANECCTIGFDAFQWHFSILFRASRIDGRVTVMEIYSRCSVGLVENSSSADKIMDSTVSLAPAINM